MRRIRLPIFREDCEDRKDDGRETPNCAKCKWSRVKVDDDKPSEPSGAFEIFLGVRVATHRGSLLCLAHGGALCTSAHDGPACRKLYEVDPMRVVELATNRPDNG